MYSISELQQIYKSYAEANRFQREPASLYQPINYLLGLGGKSMRPTLVLLGCNLFSEQVDKALPQAYAVELFHNFSLMHDDIMDNSPLRRGFPTVHIKYSPNTAILSGDAMLVYSYQYLAQSSPQLLGAILEVFNQAAIGICEGQQRDMDLAAGTTATVGEYIEMIRLKTAVLLQASLQIGALVAGAEPTEAMTLGEFGLQLGISFQLQDDYLDTFGSSAKVGKRIGGDILENKKTFLLLHALEQANPAQKQQLETLLGQKPNNEQEENAKIAAVTSLFRQLGVAEASLERSKFYYERALRCLDSLHISPDKLGYLKKFAHELLYRES